MTSAERNDLMPPQEKLEWVTPKISQLVAGDTEGKNNPFGNECAPGGIVCGPWVVTKLGITGPS